MNQVSKNDAWFSFRGEYSFEHGALMKAWPVRYQPAMKGKSRTVSGRDGAVWVGDGCYDDVEVTVEFIVPEANDRRGVNAWLTGAGRLVFGDEPDMAYDARIVKTYKRSSVTARLAGQEYQVTFLCQPFKRMLPEAADIAITASGTKIFNPGTAPALPNILINATGEFTITIGEWTMYFVDVVGGLYVDSELMDAYSLDETASANNLCSGTPFRIAPGWNEVSWTAESGSQVRSLIITPRWRCI